MKDIRTEVRYWEAGREEQLGVTGRKIERRIWSDGRLWRYRYYTVETGSRDRGIVMEEQVVGSGR